MFTLEDNINNLSSVCTDSKLTASRPGIQLFISNLLQLYSYSIHSGIAFPGHCTVEIIVTTLEKKLTFCYLALTNWI